MKLKDAISNPVWASHEIGDTYKMDGRGKWKIAYYPIFECGKTREVYNEPRALVESKSVWNGIEGTDYREVPLHYLHKNKL